MNKPKTNAISLIQESMEYFNSSILHGDEYSEIDYNYRRFRDRVFDFCKIFYEFKNPQDHFSESYKEVDGKNILEQVDIYDNKSKLKLSIKLD